MNDLHILAFLLLSTAATSLCTAISDDLVLSQNTLLWRVHLTENVLFCSDLLLFSKFLTKFSRLEIVLCSRMSNVYPGPLDKEHL